MKDLIKKIVVSVVHLYSHLYPYHLHEWLNCKRNSFYTMWLKQFIGEVGENTRFAQPIRLQGGGERNIKIGNNTIIASNSVLGCYRYYGEDIYEPEIVIGDNCIIGEFFHLSAIKRIIIGNGLLTGRFVYIGDNAHGGLSFEEALLPPFKRRLQFKGDVIIGNNVWIGDRVSVLGGVTIGDNVIIGAGSIVTKSIPSNCLAVGVPAKVIKSLMTDAIKDSV